MSVESRLETISQEMDQLTNEITKFVKSLEHDERLRQRAEERDERDRDKQHDELAKALEKLGEQVDALKGQLEGVGAGLRDLPDRLLVHIEKKIYELRVERWEAQKAGVQNEPAPLPPPPGRRDSTEKVIAQIEGKDDDSLTAAEQNALVKAGMKVWRWKFHIVGGGVGLHWIVERFGDFVKWLKLLH